MRGDGRHYDENPGRRARTQSMEMSDKRGLRCPACGREQNTRMVAESYPLEGGGQRRRRVCECGADVVSVEWVVGIKAGVMLLVHLPDPRGGRRHGPHQTASAVRAIVTANGGEVMKL